jgi:hypothetical protein
MHHRSRWHSLDQKTVEVTNRSISGHWLGDHCKVGGPTIQMSKFQRGTAIARQSGKFRLELLSSRQ